MAGPPGWEVWVITPHRTADTVARSLAAYLDRAAAEDRGDEQLMLRPLDRTPVGFAMTSSRS